MTELRTRFFSSRASLAAGVAALAAVLALAGCGMLSRADRIQLSGAMNAASQVPPNVTRGSGIAEATLDKKTNVVKYKITYTGLSGPATAAHFHGPAPSGANAGVALPFASTASPIEGQATLTPAQAADLVNGKWYANVHTAANPAGEIRGQLMPQ